MYISIVLTALILNGLFSVFGIVPESNRFVTEVAQFKIDYTFYFNIIFVLLAGWLIYLKKRFIKMHSEKVSEMDMEGDTSFKRTIAYLFIAILFGGLLVNFLI